MKTESLNEIIMEQKSQVNMQLMTQNMSTRLLTVQSQYNQLVKQNYLCPALSSSAT